MMYYRCDCCGKEQEAIVQGAHRTPTDPLGHSMRFHIPPEIRKSLGVHDLCEHCCVAFKDEIDNVTAEWHLTMKQRLTSRYDELKKKN